MNELQPAPFSARRRGRASPRSALALILCLALALGMARIACAPPTEHSGQTSDWWPLALNLIEGRGYRACAPGYFPFCGPGNDLTAMREPAPVLFFGAAALLSGRSLWAAALVELALHLAVLLAVYHLTRRWRDEGTALLAGALWAVYLPAIKLIPQVSGELPATLALTLGALFFLRARETGRARDWAGSGVCLGLAALSRSATLAVAGALAVGTVLADRGALRPRLRRLLPVLLFALAMALTLSPWVVRNWRVFGRPLIGSTLAGYNLYRQNHQLASEDYLRFVGSDEAEQAIRALLARRGDLTGAENEAQVSAVYSAEARQVIRAHPLRYAQLAAYRLLELWFNWAVRAGYELPMGVMDYLMQAQQALLLPLALLGLWGNRGRAWPLGLAVLGLTLPHLAVIARLRLFLPVMPLVISLAAAGLLDGWRRVGERFLARRGHQTSRV